METILIESKRPFSLKKIGCALSQHWPVETSPGDTLVVHGDKTRIYLHSDTESKEHGVSRLLMDYSDVDFAKRLIEIIADDPALMVDNDFGTVLPGDEFVARCRSDTGWDWRR